jgi:predicted DCC family thiol-disulfide oxidoreductase YuxK
MTDLPKFEVFFDGDCPLCAKEIALIKKLDKRQSIICTDIASSSFDAMQTLGMSQATLMEEIHGREIGQDCVTGVEVFRQLYGRTLFAFMVPITRWWGIRHSLDVGYNIFAKYRLGLTGRCRNGQCAIPS